MIEFEKRAMTEVEDKYTFSQSSQISGQCGLIGHLRADMDSDGNGFFSTWFDYRKDLKTDDFKEEFNNVINSLREDGDILHNRKALANYCYSTPQSRMNTTENYFGVRVDSEKYKHIIWSDKDLDLEDWRESLEELYPGYSDDELYEKMYERFFKIPNY